MHHPPSLPEFYKNSIVIPQFIFLRVDFILKMASTSKRAAAAAEIRRQDSRLTFSGWQRLNLKSLQLKCDFYDLLITGKKDELAKRLFEYFNKDSSSSTASSHLHPPAHQTRTVTADDRGHAQDQYRDPHSDLQSDPRLDPLLKKVSCAIARVIALQMMKR